MHRRIYGFVLTLALASTALLPQFGAAAHADPPPNQPPNTDWDRVELDPVLAAAEAPTAPIDSSDAPLLGAPAVQCQYGTRYSTNPTDSGKRAIFVYILTAGGATDEHLDQPKLCSDGKLYSSALDLMYRDQSAWLAKHLAGSAFGSRRFTPVARNYTNPYTGTVTSTYASFYCYSDIATSSWNAMTPQEKANANRSELIACGYVNANYVYVGIVAARQTTGDAGTLTTAGSACFNCAGTTSAYAYVLRVFRGGDGIYYNAPFGCANYAADALVTHELSHVVGAVPLNAPFGDGQSHMANQTPADDLERRVRLPFSRDGSTTLLAYDGGVDDYRHAVLDKDWDTTGFASNLTLRQC